MRAVAAAGKRRRGGDSGEEESGAEQRIVSLRLGSGSAPSESRTLRRRYGRRDDRPADATDLVHVREEVRAASQPSRRSKAGLVAFLLHPGPPRWWPLLVRLVAAAVFISTGLGKFAYHDAYVDRFERWGFGGAAGEVAILVGLMEVVCGLMMLLGVAPRAAALVLMGDMVGALATAGRIDGGQDIWLPLVMLAALAGIVVERTGRWSLV